MDERELSDLSDLMERFLLTLDETDPQGDMSSDRDNADCVLCSFYNWIQSDEE